MFGQKENEEYEFEIRTNKDLRLFGSNIIEIVTNSRIRCPVWRSEGVRDITRW